MHNQDTINQFIDARARCVPYGKIADALKVSRCTLLAWGQKYKTEIDGLRAIEAEAIRAKYLGTREQEVEFLAQRLQRLEATFDQHKPIYIPIRQLADMIRMTRERLDQLCAEPQFPQLKKSQNEGGSPSTNEPKN